MQRRAALQTLGSAMGGLLLALSCPNGVSAAQTVQPPQAANLPAIKSAVRDATGYTDEDFELDLRPSQIVITIVNSRLNKSQPRERDAEASKIVDSVTEAAVGDPHLGGVLGIHIDYVARSSDGAHTDIVDAIDFRKGSDGRFVHHMT